MVARLPDASASADPQLIPPAEMLIDGSSSPDDFVRVGEGFCDGVLITRAQLQPSAVVLDLGCGNGQIARPLTSFLSPSGRYEGIDIHEPSILWLQQHYSSYRNFHFAHVDVYNKVYNLNGQVSAAHYQLPFEDATFDLVVLKSVFTHMLPDDVHNYLCEIGRVLKPGGRSVITYFLLNDESRRFIESGMDTFKLTFEYDGDRLCRIANPAAPEAVVAHDERRVREYYAETGCDLQEIAFGNWCGRESRQGLQDWVIAAKQSSDSLRRSHTHRVERRSRMHRVARALSALRSGSR